MDGFITVIVKKHGLFWGRVCFVRVCFENTVGASPYSVFVNLRVTERPLSLEPLGEYPMLDIVSVTASTTLS